MEVSQKNVKRTHIGEVVSDKMDKTVTVEVIHTFKHPRVHKILRRTKKYKVHDEQNIAKTGDQVEFYEGKPVSKTKYMYLTRVVKSQLA
jgi:small subunit ribosomal protein S17